MMGFFRDERQFVSSFLKGSRERYNHLLFPKNPNHTSTLSLKHLYDASNDHTVGGFVQEVKHYNVLIVLIILNEQVLISWMKFLVVGNGKH